MRARLVGIAAVLALTGTAACGLLIGLEDHELYPAEGGIVEGGRDSTTGGDTGSHAEAGADADAQLDGPADTGIPCDASVCNGACVDLQSDRNNCGTCGTVCDAAACYHGTCGGATVTSISAGTEHACVLLQSGDVLCWGADDQAQILGPGDAGSCPLGPCRTAPTPIGGLPRAVQISAGGNQTCALDGDGGVWCWGANPAGGLGHAPSTDSTCATADASVPCNAQPAAVTGLPGPATLVTSGELGFACALVTGSVYCWGDDTYGELGPSADGGPSPTPQLVVPTATTVAAGYAHVCAMLVGGPSCWGSNVSGELGHAPGTGDSVCAGTFCNPVPQNVPVPGALRVRAGYHASCFETISDPYCVGANDVGQLGGGSSNATPNTTASEVTIGGGTFGASTTLDFHYKTVCALALSNAYCWGDDETRQTSDFQDSLCGSVPCVVDGYQVPLVNVIQLHTAPYASFALTDDGKVWAWGNDGEGQLGTPGDAGAEGGCDPAAFPPSGTVCNYAPKQVQGLP